MILLTVGSELPFSRLVAAFDCWCLENPDLEVKAQIGEVQPSDYVPKAMEWVRLLSAADFGRLQDSAHIIVAHAGMGSIISALTLGKPIVILPRRAQLGEHRNDHQLATATRFKDREGVFVAWSETELASAVNAALAKAKSGQFARLPTHAPDGLTQRLRAFILGGSED